IYTSNNYELKEEFTEGPPLAERLFTAKVKAIKGSRDSKEALKSKGALILSSSGMVNGGKVMQYVKKMISDKSNLLAIVGFQAEGTTGRELVEGARKVEVDEQIYNVAAEISVFRGFSAHADREDLLGWLDTFDKSRLKKIFLVHAEPEQSLPFQQRLANSAYDSIIPSIGDKFTL
ncbi:MAG: MBL fold metallo-hydrolase RNA specificity domain-containing protein, partial [Candidatus Dojkabacteria bacterium]